MRNTKTPGGREGSLLLGRELRLRRGHRSYAEMARLSTMPPCEGRVDSISASYLHKLEHGKRVPTLQTLRTLSLLYGIAVERMVRLVEAEDLQQREPESWDPEQLLDECRAAIRIGDCRLAFSAALRAEELATTREQVYRARGNKAAAMWKLGYPQEAAGQLQEMLADQQMGHRFRVNYFYTLAAIYRSLWNLPLAEVFGRQGLDDAVRCPDELGEERAALRRLLGNILSDRAEQDEEAADRLCREAIRYYEHSLEEFRCMGRKDQAALTVTNIGVAHRIEGNQLLAFQRLRQGLDDCRDCSYGWGTAFTLKELGRAYQTVGQWDTAKKQLLEAESEASRNGYSDIQFQAIVHLVEGALERGETADPLIRRAQGLLPSLEARFPERDRFEEVLRTRIAVATSGGAA